MIKLSPSQLRVVEEFPGFLSDDTPEMTISGFAGSGKSFLVEYLAKVAEKQHRLLQLTDKAIPNRTFHFTATTNKAAAVLADMLHNTRPVTTIHKLLGLVLYNDYTTGKQRLTQKDRVTNLTNTLVFIDEASMINFELLEHIREAQKNYRNCKLVFIGDAYQLPPVREDVCPVFNPDASNVFFLNEIQRQVADSPIIQLSAEYRDTLDNHERDWPVIPHDDEHIFHYKDKKPFFQAIKAAYMAPHRADQFKIVAWSNHRVQGYNKWIRKLQGRVEDFEIGETVVTNKPLFFEGNLIAGTDTLHTISNVHPGKTEDIPGYFIELYSKVPGFVPVFFQPADWKQADQLAAKFAAMAKAGECDWQPYFSIKEFWTDFRPIHASTVHKAQGSTYEEVFVDLENIGTNRHWREVARLVYVAITRASKRVHIYGELCMNYNRQPPENLLEGFIDVESL